jgi:phage terminase small subunit
MTQELNSKQLKFVQEYLVDLNAKQAAIRAGYSARTAEACGPRLLRNVKVAQEIQARMDKRSQKLEISAERVLKEIACMSFYDPKDFENVKSLEDIKTLPEEVRRAIVGWKWDKNGNFTLILASKTASLDQLGRHLKLFTDKLEVSGTDALAERIKAARESKGN